MANKTSEKQLGYARKYSAEKTRYVTMHLVKSGDKDILDKLESVPSKQGYIKALIRADIARSSQKGQEGGSTSSGE